jgi:hypothetical protein
MLRVQPISHSLIWLSSLTFSLGCTLKPTTREDHASSSPGAAGVSGPPADTSVSAEQHGQPELGNYPRARWRLVPPDRLNHVVLWVSHILIRHQSSRMTEPPLTAATLPVGEPPSRTRSEALALAQRIAAQAATNPVAFPELSQRYSEDTATRSFGGSLGGIRASQLIAWPNILDALSELKPNETSRVVETMFGFHVLYRREAPQEQRVSGKRIVIGHDETPWLAEHAARRPIPRRASNEARLLAAQIHRQLSKHPERIGQLVHEHSEHKDALRHGDIGQWSTREPSSLARQVEALAGLNVGEVARPMESLFGIELLIRTPLHERELYAIETIVVHFDPSVTDDAPDSQKAAAAETRRLATQLATEPRRFGEFQKQFHSENRLQWEQGRGDPTLELATQRTPIGQISREPLLLDAAYHLIRRVPPSPTGQSEVDFELPRPEEPDLQYLWSQAPPPWLQTQASQLGELAITELSLSGSEADQISNLHALQVSDESSAQECASLLRDLFAQVAPLLGESRFESYTRLANRHFAERWLASRVGP